ncbi:MAG: Maf family protein [Candidatus Paceibacterota bacterium]|nr:Maf family protein [Candidatus Paceibacterota bacterium]
MNKKLILASGSPRRKELLEKAGFLFEVVVSEYEEDMTLQLSPTELVKHLSYGKAETVANTHPDAIVLSADTIVVLDGTVLGKPHTGERAKEMLRMLSGKQHSVWTGFTIILKSEEKSISRAVESKVIFKDLSDKEIEEYIATGEPLEKAGAYAIQMLGQKFVEKTDGDIPNIIGLPIDEVQQELRKNFGFSPNT